MEDLAAVMDALTVAKLHFFLANLVEPFLVKYQKKSHMASFRPVRVGGTVQQVNNQQTKGKTHLGNLMLQLAHVKKNSDKRCCGG